MKKVLIIFTLFFALFYSDVVGTAAPLGEMKGKDFSEKSFDDELNSLVKVEEVGTNLPQSNEITYEVNKDLSDDEIRERFDEINNKYEINAPFTKEHAEFVVYYSNNKVVDQSESSTLLDVGEFENNIDTAALKFYKGTTSKRFFQQKVSSGVTAQFVGLITNHNNSLNISDQWYKGKTTVNIMKGNSKVKSIKTVVKVSTYGLIGSGGTYVGLVYNGQVGSSTKSNKINTLDEIDKYTAVAVVYSHINAYATVTTAEGSFNIYAF